MFHRVLLDHWMAIFPLVAFLTAATVCAFIVMKALRMRQPQVDHFASLPFNDEPVTIHETKL